jgi:hypothetical protein
MTNIRNIAVLFIVNPEFVTIVREHLLFILFGDECYTSTQLLYREG